jgi:3',5'-cyclic AMP phosphodiesterase CpdA
VKIVQMSDLHVGEGLFRPELLRAAIEESNELAPDLVVIAGDLTRRAIATSSRSASGF